MRKSDGDDDHAGDRNEVASNEPAAGDASPPRRKRLRPVRWCAVLLLFIVVVAAAGLLAVNGGLVDGLLTAKAREALQSALGPELTARIQGTGIRLSANGRFELRARGVEVLDHDTKQLVAAARSVDIHLASWPLLHGEIDVRSLVVDDVKLDPGAFGSDATAIDLDAVRVDALGGIMNTVFAGADRLHAVFEQGRVGTIRITDTAVDTGGRDLVPLAIESLTLGRASGGGVRLDGVINEAGERSRLTAAAVPDGVAKRIESLKVDLDGFDTAPFLLQKGAEGAPAMGIATKVDLSISAARGGKHPPALDASIVLAPGQFYADGTPSPIRSGRLDLDYNFAKRSIDIRPSQLKVGASTFPFNGGIIDLSNLDRGDRPGYGFELISNGAVSAPSDSDEPGLPFSGKVFAKYLKNERKLVVDQMAIATPVGSLAGSLQIVGEEKSPEISFAATIDHMRTAAIKQLWPYWLAVHAREWVLANLYGGDVSNGSIKLFIPKNKIAENAGEMRFGPTELQVGFDYSGARLNVAGDIPPLRNAAGHFSLKGTQLDIALDEATAYFPSGRSVDAGKGTFSIPDTDVHPLMATLDMVVSGKADAVAELVSYDPINALQRTDYKPDDFAGDVVSHVQATFGLLQQQHPPKPVWKVDATLKNVDVSPPIDGHAFRDLAGTLKVDPDKALLDTDAKIDGFPMHIELTEPFEKDSPVSRQRVITARLGNAARRALLPGLDELLDGPVDVVMTRTGEGKQDVKADLTDASLHIPGLGWTKGQGIKATATFSTDDQGGNLAVNDFVLQGSGFSVGGTIRIADNQLSKAHFPNVRLSSRDSFAVDIDRSGKGYAIDLDGASIDLRSLIKGIRNDGGLSGGGDAVPLDITAKADTAYGFNEEKLNGLTLHYSGRGGQIGSLDAKAVTTSGRAFVASTKPGKAGLDLTLTCGDAGALARFADVYAKLDGGLLNLRLQKSGANPYVGSLDIHDFSIRNEQRLHSIVDARPSRSGHSLRDTFNGEVNLSAPKFSRAYAKLRLGNDSLTISDGILRGVQIGSTFQGTVYDANGNMNITGTFMPAYGLNRLFADVPILGVILGNGRDRGLIGITYRLTGKVSAPKVEVNPLSVIAPGVFRQIFEY